MRVIFRGSESDGSVESREAVSSARDAKEFGVRRRFVRPAGRRESVAQEQFSGQIWQDHEGRRQPSHRVCGRSGEALESL